MPWDLVKLNDGEEVGTGRLAYDFNTHFSLEPFVVCREHDTRYWASVLQMFYQHSVPHAYDLFSYSSFGTWKIPVGHTTTDQVDQAISVGFSHIGKLLLSS